MSNIKFDTKAYAKIILHAAKYPHCSINGLLLSEASNAKDASKELNIVDSVPLFHHCLDVSPMAEVGLTQVEAAAQISGMVISGYYVANENFNISHIVDNPGMKIAEKIAEYFPQAVVVVVDNKKLMQHLKSPAIKLYQNSDGKWKSKENFAFASKNVLDTVSHLLQRGVHKELIDFDNYLDDVKHDWSNSGLHKLLDTIEKAN